MLMNKTNCATLSKIVETKMYCFSLFNSYELFKE
jgi:hypothetical protein